MKLTKPLLLSVLLLTGCASSLLKSNEPAPTIYSLRPTSDLQAIEAPAKFTAKIIEIQRPALPPGFDTAQIGMYLADGRQINYFTGAKWPSPLDDTLQEFTNQTARLMLPSLIVTYPGQSIETNYRLQIRVNDFEPIYTDGPNQPPQLVASLTFNLLAMPDEKLLTSFTVEQKKTADGNSLGSITDGLQGLLQSVEQQAFTTIAGHVFKK